MAELNPQPLPPGREIRVLAPEAVLYDLDAFQRALRSVLGHTGCQACTSGINFRWQVFEEFVVNQAGEARPTARSLED